MLMQARTVILGVVLGWSFMAPAAAETHAVVVGIDKYATVTQLHGAAADAKDISAALQKAGVTDIVSLIDESATRKNVLGAIDQMIAHVHKDDLAIITFAGHGAREQWGKVRPPGTELKELHEVFLLRNMAMPDRDGKIDPGVPGSAAERIMGAEMAVRLKRLDDLGARTIFVADACFGGGLSRKPLIDVHYSIRVVSDVAFYADGADPLLSQIRQLPAPINTDKETHALSFLAAVDDETTAPEVEIPKGTGNMRGALSYAFARVIEGAALQNGKTDLTHGDLITYTMNSIKNSLIDSGTSQRPDLRPKQGFDRVAIRFGTDLKLAAAAAAPTPVQVQTGPMLRVYTENGKPIEPFRRPELDLSVQPTADRSQADFIYRPASGEVYSKGGDLIVSRMLPVDIPDIAEREIAIRRLIELAKTRPRSLTLDRGDRRYLAGDVMSLNARRSEGQKGPDEYYLLLVISGNGLVQFEYPLDTDPEKLPDLPLGQMGAREPFGADYVVFVTDEQPMRGLIKSLRGLDGSRSSNVAVSMIEKALTPTMRIGLQPVYTAPRP